VNIIFCTVITAVKLLIARLILQLQLNRGFNTHLLFVTFFYLFVFHLQAKVVDPSLISAGH